MSLREKYLQVEINDAAAWRDWLEANHATSTGIWLVTYKKSSGKSRFSYEEMIEEALRYGWIDSTANALDEERSMLLLTPRKRGSVWSAPNKARVERLIASGRMLPQGMAKIETAQADGSWDTLNDIDALIVPPDLAAALDATPGARDGYEAFSRSVKKQVLFWVQTAKREETRAKRIASLAEAAAEGRNPIEYVPKDRR